MNAIGQHLLIDCWGCSGRADDAQAVRAAMLEAVNAMAGTLLELNVHRFSPQGLTAVAILSESHLALHSWPEEDYVAVDAFTCGGSVSPEAGIEVLRRYLQPAQISQRVVLRGCPPPDWVRGQGPAMGLSHDETNGVPAHERADDNYLS